MASIRQPGEGVQIPWMGHAGVVATVAMCRVPNVSATQPMPSGERQLFGCIKHSKKKKIGWIQTFLDILCSPDLVSQSVFL